MNLKKMFDIWSEFCTCVEFYNSVLILCVCEMFWFNNIRMDYRPEIDCL